MKDKLIIILIVLVIIVLVGFGGYFAYNKYNEQDIWKVEWVNIYYDYMKQNHEEIKRKEKSLKYYRENEKIEFCKIEAIEIPVMLYNYEELGEKFTNIFYISDNKVNLLQSLKKDLEVKYLYDIEESNYDYYIHEVNGKEEKYSKISECIKANKVNENQKNTERVKEIDVQNVVTLETGDIISITTIDGQTLEILKYDLKFIETDVVEKNWKEINFDNYEDGIKKDFSIAVDTMKEELTDLEREEVIQKEEKIKEKKEKMIKAVEEIKQKQKEEEEKRLAEEELRKKEEAEAAKKKAEEEARRLAEEQRNQDEINNENYTLKYGKYKGIDCWSTNDPLSKYETTIVINEDGTYTQTNVIIAAEMTEEYTGTYKIVDDQNLGRIIILSANDAWYKITGNNQITSVTGSIIKYEGN